MPFLADLEEPPRSRVRGLVFGFLLALPIIYALVVWAIPALVSTVLGGAESLDAKLRQQDAYMRSLCTGAFDPERDEALCSCVLAVEFPSLDCRAKFLTWALSVQAQQCGSTSAKTEALSFCTCVETIAGRVAEAADGEREQAATAYERCEALPDALPLPVPEGTPTP